MSDYALRRTTMVDTQVRPNDVTKFPIIEAMLAVPKEAFLPPRLREAAYASENVEVAPGRVVLEARTFAKMLDALNIGPDDRVLDVGCCLGYSSAVIARMAKSVVALEEDPELAAGAEEALASQGVVNAVVRKGPLAAGAKDDAPYQVIAVQGAVEELPAALADQLAEGGRIGCLFITGPLGVCRIGLKSEGRISWRPAFDAGAPVLPGFARPRAFAL